MAYFGIKFYNSNIIMKTINQTGGFKGYGDNGYKSTMLSTQASTSY